MKKYYFTFITILLLAFLATFSSCESSNDDKNVCVLTGKLIDRPETKVLVLLKYGDDFRIKSDEIKVRRDGSFKHLIKDTNCLYNLICEDDLRHGAFRPATFISSPGDSIYMQIYPFDDNVNMNLSSGSEDNDRYNYLTINSTFQKTAKNYKDSCLRLLEPMYEDGSAYTSEYKNLIKKCEEAAKSNNLELWDSLNNAIAKAKNNQYTEKARRIVDLYSAKNKECILWQMEQISKTIDVAGLAVLSSVASSDMIDIKDYMTLVNSYNATFPTNHLTKILNNALLSSSLSIGSKFIDFELTDEDGTTSKLSELVKGKVAVIDLWSSFCGPCIRKSISFIPVWEKFSSSNFTIIGVARENDESIIKMRQILDKYKFPWKNFVELNDKENIWSRCNMTNAGGSVFLLDENFTILAIDFDSKELESHLNMKF